MTLYSIHIPGPNNMLVCRKKKNETNLNLPFASMIIFPNLFNSQVTQVYQ